MSKYFGTDGIRGVANKELTAHIAYRIGRFLGQYKKNKTANNILIARDTRISGQLLLNGLVAGILSSGGNVTDLGISTTPSVAYLTRKKGFTFGIMISASHNPYYDNGIKLFKSNGEKIDKKTEELLDQYIDSLKDYLPLAKNEYIGTYTYAPELTNEYIDKLMSGVNINKDTPLLIDCANGSCSFIAKDVFSKLPITHKIINKQPNGVNINFNCGSTHLDHLSEKLQIENQYEYGVAFDGDGDRVLLVNKDGNHLDGDYLIYALAKCLAKLGRLKNNTVVVTVMSNLGLLKALEKSGINYEIVDVGDRHIQERMIKKGYSLGGEQSGHIILADYLLTGDGLLVVTHLLSLLEEAELTLEEALVGFTKLPQVLVNVIVPNKEAILNHKGLNDLINESTKELGDTGRILVRASGTEPKIRVMVEAETLEECNKHANKIKQYIEDLV